MSRNFAFTLPTGKEELIEKFLSVEEGPQRVLLSAIQHGTPEPGQEGVGARLLEWLRTDERTCELVTQLESTPPPRLTKSKASRRSATRK